jgi:TPP-dependent pyruvate/acetoin dehydrogenase alpha subunit
MVATDKILAIHLRILRIRRFEKEVGKCPPQGQLPGLVHLGDGADALAMDQAAAEAAARARLGKGRSLIEAKTQRRGGHAEGEEAFLAGQRYCSDEEQLAARQQDPLLRLHGYIADAICWRRRRSRRWTSRLLKPSPRRSPLPAIAPTGML